MRRLLIFTLISATSCVMSANHQDSHEARKTSTRGQLPTDGPSNTHGKSTPTTTSGASTRGTAVTVSVCVVLLLFVGLVAMLLICKWRNRKTTSSSFPPNITKMENSVCARVTEISHSDCDYEEINDLKPCSPAGAAPIYSTAQLPTILSEYDNIQHTSHPAVHKISGKTYCSGRSTGDNEYDHSVPGPPTDVRNSAEY